MARLPIRARVIGAFALAMAVVLAATGVFVYARVARDLGRNLDEDLRLRAQDVSVLVRARDAPLAADAGGRLVERGESFVELVTPQGRVLDATPPIGRALLLRPGELRGPPAGRCSPTAPRRPGSTRAPACWRHRWRRGGRRLVLVVGATRENRAEALRNLRTELLVAGPIALLLAIALGYLLAGAGLRAVEEMRRRAAAISADRRGERLPVPRTGDELSASA